MTGEVTPPVVIEIGEERFPLWTSVEVVEALPPAATDLAGLISDAMKLWDEFAATGEDQGDPSLAECIKNNWTLAEFLGLYLVRRPVDIRASTCGLVDDGWLAYDGERTVVEGGDSYRVWREAESPPQRSEEP